MPCLPGFLPVMKLLHAWKLHGGSVERSGPWTPRSMSRARFGSLPCSTQGRTRSHVAPSQPIRKTRCMTMPLFLGLSVVRYQWSSQRTTDNGRLHCSGVSRTHLAGDDSAVVMGANELVAVAGQSLTEC